MALDVSALTKRYRQRLPELEHTSNAIELLIRRYRDTTGNDIVRSYDIGVEEESSFLEKAMMQGVSVQNVWDKVDVLGFRIVCLFSDDIVRIENEFVKEHFKILDAKRYEWTELDARSKTPVEARKAVEDGYTSVRYIVRLNDPSAFKVQDWPFEIQCMTMLEEAWAEFSDEPYATRFRKTNLHENGLACPQCTSTNVTVIVYYRPPGRADVERIAKDLLQERYPPYYWTEAVQQRLKEERARNLAKTENRFREKAEDLRRREELGEITVRRPVVDFEQNDWHCNSCGNDWKRKSPTGYGEPMIEYDFDDILRLYSNGRVQLESEYFQDPFRIRRDKPRFPSLPKKILKEFWIPAKAVVSYAERLELAGFFDLETVYRTPFGRNSPFPEEVRLIYGNRRKEVVGLRSPEVREEIREIFDELLKMAQARAKASRFESLFRKLSLLYNRDSRNRKISFPPDRDWVRDIVRAELEMKYRRFVKRLAVIAVGSLTASIVSILVGGPAGQILALAGLASTTISFILIPRGAKADFTLD